MKHNNLSSRPTRKLIYVPSEELWESVKEAAKEDGRSASNYLIQLHKKSVRKAEGFMDEACEISESVYRDIKPIKSKAEIIRTPGQIKTLYLHLGDKK